MFQITIIVFREILEIALILGILIAATSGVRDRSKYILSGLGLGVLGSIIIAFFTSNISELFDGMGQEIFNAFILFASALMIAWTVIWMKKHAKSLSADLKELGRSVSEGEKPLIALLPITALTIFREGAEIVLFSYGSYVSGISVLNIAIGGLIGLTLGSIVGVCLYLGLIKAFGKHFFLVTSYLLTFLAAGMVAQSLGLLSNIGLVPVIKDQLWDSSFLLAQHSMIGEILHVLIGYVDRPSAIQFLGYIVTLVILWLSINCDKFSKQKS